MASSAVCKFSTLMPTPRTLTRSIAMKLKSAISIWNENQNASRTVCFKQRLL
jgi:hypothetical protein